MKAGVVGKIFPTILSQGVKLILKLFNFISRTELLLHDLFDLVPSHSKSNFGPTSTLFFIPPCECSFMENTHGVTNLEVVGALTVDEGILNTLKPLEESCSSFFTTKLRRVTRVEMLKGAGWGSISIAIAVPIPIPVAVTIPVAVHLDDLSE